MKYIYYPGCSLKSTGRVYEESILAVFKALSIPLEELQDWNCCGATTYMSVDELKAFGLAARNLGLAEMQAGNEEANLITPCSACFLVLLKTQKYLESHPDIAEKVQRALKEAGIKYEGKIKIRHPLDVLMNDFGPEYIGKFVKNPLKGLKVVCYYGCQTIRPFLTFDNDRNPMIMDKLAQTLGADTVDYPLKTRCCGGSLTGTIEQVGLRLSYRLIKEASRRKADIMLTACSLCQFNLECYQSNMSKRYNDNVHMPIVYFSQFMGMAFGLPDKEIGIHRLFISPWEIPVLKKGGKHVYA